MAQRHSAPKYAPIARALLVAAGISLVAQPALARRPPAQNSLAGDYLAATIAGADHDAKSAALYYRRALAADPRNVDLVERAFTSMLAAGEIESSFPFAQKLVAREKRNALARLTLAVKDLREQ